MHDRRGFHCRLAPSAARFRRPDSDGAARVKQAAKAAKIARGMHYKWLKNDPAYPALGETVKAGDEQHGAALPQKPE
jgi:hypothetical protein